MPCPVLHIDAFADRPFTGNPAAVCLLDAPRDREWMQAVATELNLSETAFVVAAGKGYDLRWFTPVLEVDLCGHATLAAAHALWSEGLAPLAADLVFQTRSGRLTASRRADRIQLDFPATPVEPCPPFPELTGALGTTITACGRTAFDLFARVDDEATLRGLAPDFHKLKQLAARGIIVTSTSATPAYDFITRFFAPASGIDEDPVTGSAFCALAPYWQEQTGRSQLTGHQASPRGGTVWSDIAGDRVLLQGTAVTVTRGEWVV